MEECFHLRFQEFFYLILIAKPEQGKRDSLHHPNRIPSETENSKLVLVGLMPEITQITASYHGGFFPADHLAQEGGTDHSQTRL